MNILEAFLKFSHVLNDANWGVIKGSNTTQAIYSTLYLEMYFYIVHDSSLSWEECLESIFRFSHLLIRGLIKGLSPNWGIFSTFSVETYYYIVHNGSTPQDKVLESIFKFSHLLIRGLLPNWVIFITFSIDIYIYKIMLCIMVVHHNTDF